MKGISLGPKSTTFRKQKKQQHEEECDHQRPI
jgi:hypothetical protein